MENRIELNPMQQSYLRGMESKYGLFSKACYVYAYDKDVVERERLKAAILSLPEVHPLLGAALHEESLVLQAGTLALKEELLWETSMESQAESLFQSFTPDATHLAEVTLLTGTCDYIVFCVNGIIADGLSHERIIETLEKLYLGEAVHPVACAAEFLNYTRELRTEKAFIEQCAQLDAETASFPEPVTLAIADEFYTETTPGTAMRKIPVSLALWDAVKQKAASKGTTVFSVMMALVAKAISQYTETPSFVLNIPGTARLVPIDGIFDAVGMYSDFSLIPVDTAVPDVFTLAKTLSSDLMEQQFRGAVSGLDVLKSWKKKNFAAAAPFVFTSLVDLTYESRLFSRRFVRTQTSQVWFEMLLFRCGEELTLEVSYQPEAIPTVMTEHILHTVVREMEKIAYPELEREGPAPESACIGIKDLLVDRFANGGERPFVLWSNGQLTCREADLISSELCHKLHEHTALTPGKSRIGVFLKKGPLQAITSIAATKAGVAFLPLDLDYPTGTIAAIAKRAALSLIVTEPSLADQIKETGVPYYVVTEHLLHTGMPDREPYTGYDWDPEEPFVIINTSGTTGEPKSAAIKAAGVVNCLLDSVKRFSLDDTDRCIAITNYCHDMALFDIYGMLACGGAIVYPDAERTKDPAHWAALMCAHQVTFWNSVPAFMEMLAADSRNFTQALAGLRTVVMGGDFLSVNLVKQLKTEKPELSVHSVGGPTETTIWNISHEIQDEDLQNGSIPYGKAFSNTTYYVLNSVGQALPVGVIGEMCVAGVGVSTGYLGMPEVTEQVFTQWENRRIYHTGDYGFFRENGDLMIIGRRDGQVKINGKRIELRGIEEILSAYPGVNQVVVVKSAESKKLVAFYSGDSAVDISGWKSFVQSRLPAYMIPACFLRLDSFPLTRNGKVDRTALSKFQSSEEEGRTEQKKRHSGNHTVTDKLIEMCQQLFPGEEIDETMNYYVIGGDSIQAIKLLSMIKEEFNVSFSVYDILEAPFLQSWAELIQERLADSAQKTQHLVSLVETVVGLTGTSLFLTEGIEERLKTLSVMLEAQGIRKNPYELLAEPYLEKISVL